MAMVAQFNADRARTRVSGDRLAHQGLVALSGSDTHHVVSGRKRTSMGAAVHYVRPFDRRPVHDDGVIDAAGSARANTRSYRCGVCGSPA